MVTLGDLEGETSSLVSLFIQNMLEPSQICSTFPFQGGLLEQPSIICSDLRQKFTFMSERRSSSAGGQNGHGDLGHTLAAFIRKLEILISSSC